MSATAPPAATPAIVVNSSLSNAAPASSSNSISSVMNASGTSPSALHTNGSVTLPPITIGDSQAKKHILNEDEEPRVTNSMSNPSAPHTLMGKTTSSSRHSSSVQSLLNPTEDNSAKIRRDVSMPSPRMMTSATASPSAKVIENHGNQQNPATLPNLSTSVVPTPPPQLLASLTPSSRNSPAPLNSAASTVAAVVAAGVRNSPRGNHQMFDSGLPSTPGAIDEPKRKRLRVS